MKKLKQKNGVSMAELLLVVAIIVILLGVVFLALSARQRSLGQLERDGIAKEIFVAAQNHLSALYGEGYLEVTDFGTPGTAEGDAEKEIYYYTVNGSLPLSSALGQMLPFGSIDETVRLGGSYVLRYQKSTGLVLDVFYCTRTGSPERYNHILAQSEYQQLLALRDTESENHKRDRRDWNGSILGWYGGAEAALLPSTSLLAPQLIIHNEEKLYVEIIDPNADNPNAQLKLIVTGLSSGAQKSFTLKSVPDEPDRVIPPLLNNYTVILDDVTTPGLQFGALTAELGSFIPGENISVQLTAYSNSALTRIARSPKSSVNSLFGGINEGQDCAYIANIRHLENLDKAISHMDEGDGLGENDQLKIAQAEQTDSFSWVEFQKAIRRIESKSVTGTASEAGYTTVGVVDFAGNSAGAGYYMPISPDYTLCYDGKMHSISDVAANAANAGLFGVTDSVEQIRNLELLDFDITGSVCAGTLAADLGGCEVTNVLCRESEAASPKTVTAPTAGGLIGRVDSACAVRYCGAALTVEGSDYAGGLIGAANGEITGCFTGGHTRGGSYEEWLKRNPYDVRGGTVGGLVGRSNAVIYDSYSTCSVSGATAGGFAGSAEGRIVNSYATGLVDKAAASKYAFLGAGNADISRNYYYMYVNELPKSGAHENETEPMKPVSGYSLASGISRLKPIDLNEDSYNDFTGLWDDWSPALAFDPALVRYYSGKYTLRTVNELNPSIPEGYDDWNALYVSTHYGDWPSPETLFVNE